MNIDTFVPSSISSIVMGVSAATHKIAGQLTLIVARKAWVIAKDHKGMTDVFFQRDYGHFSKKIFSTDVRFNGEKHFIVVTIWEQGFFRGHSKTDQTIRKELQVCRDIYKLAPPDFRGEFRGSD